MHVLRSRKSPTAKLLTHLYKRCVNINQIKGFLKIEKNVTLT